MNKEKETDTQEKKKSCFIITPIDNPDSEMFRHISGVIKSVVRPVLCKNFGFGEVSAAHEIDSPGSINNQVINRIIGDDLVIANLTGNNPNVMYELCLRHATAKPVIHICENGTNLPFDLKAERTIFYRNDMLGTEELKDRLISIISGIDYEKEYKDNPIYTAVSIDKILKEADTQDGMSLVVNMLQNINKQLSVNTLNSQENYSSFQEKYVVLVECLNCDRDVAWDFIHSLVSNKNNKQYIMTALDMDKQCFNALFHSKNDMINVTQRMQELADERGIELSFRIVN